MDPRKLKTEHSESAPKKQQIDNVENIPVKIKTNLRLFTNFQEVTLNLAFKVYDISEAERSITDSKATGIETDSYYAFRLYKPLIQKNLVHPIVLSVVQGELMNTEVQIKQRPHFSAFKGEAIDYSQRTISQVTPFQAALCTQDEVACEILGKHMTDEEIVCQFNEIIPEGIEAHFASQTPFDFSELVDVITNSRREDGTDEDVCAALKKQENDSLLCETLKKFRNNFTDRSAQEKVYNPQHLIRALQLYDENFVRWNWNQRDLFWRQVVGYVQRFLPANIAQDFAQGLIYRVNQNENANHSFKFRFGGGSIFPLNFNSGLGFDWAVGMSPQPGARGGGNTRAWFGYCGWDIFSKYMSNKQDKLLTLFRMAWKREESRRVLARFNPAS